MPPSRQDFVDRWKDEISGLTLEVFTKPPMTNAQRGEYIVNLLLSVRRKLGEMYDELIPSPEPAANHKPAAKPPESRPAQR